MEVLLFWGYLGLDVKYATGLLQSPVMDLELQQTMDTLQLRRKSVSLNGPFQSQWIIDIFFQTSMKIPLGFVKH